VATREPLVAITFDDGPHPVWTPRVLDVLDAHGAKGTFFVVGDRVVQHPDVMTRLHRDGHAIGNHSQRHPSFPLIASRERRAELRACAQALDPYPQQRRLFRPPHLDQNLGSRIDAWRLGYDVIACNRHATDWEERSSDELALALNGSLQAGDIVMLHDALYDRPDASRAALVDALDAMLTHHTPHFRFVTVPVLMNAGRARRELWFKRPAIGRARPDA
jgi:peptidoglycan-N-acetylglucosamine deacetylase